MKRILRSAAVIVFFLTLASCSRKQAPGRKKAFLKDRAKILESQITWSDDVSAADQPLPEKLTVSPDLQQYPLVHIAATRFDSLPKSYPYLEGFASLDTSAYSDASLATAEGFCRALEAGKGEDSFMDKDFLYSLALFKYALSPDGKGSSSVKILSHILGKPLTPQGNSGSLQCPVRLTLAGGGVCDIYLYLVKSGPDWKVHQIDFMKQEETDEHERR